ncbi:hypothetical protein FOA43_004337 [Brettanomyces nanus]|uniref:non-specific serine/threonine protein kinase n=1 Tax=Eeniella nana TaxID=13502 RepID=A0A875S7Q9_EENNA|nr:uncharacterized protein FOA43_004337 [Brettanomyces nanus]QPG76943.1 hypothetical protein FOA43_004337 [Brettanomyces nanus]
MFHTQTSVLRHGGGFYNTLVLLGLISLYLSWFATASAGFSFHEHSTEDQQPIALGGDIEHHNDDDEALSRKDYYAGMFPKAVDQIKVTNLLLASDIEGNIHALNRHTGELVWSLVGDGPLVSIVSDQEPEIRPQLRTTSTSYSSKSHSTNGMERFLDAQSSTVNANGNNNSSNIGGSGTSYTSSDMTWIIEPFNDGTIYHFTPQNGLQKLPASIKQLVMKSPFSLGDEFIYTGVRKSGIVKVNARTGKLVSSYGIDCATSGEINGEDHLKTVDNEFDDDYVDEIMNNDEGENENENENENYYNSNDDTEDDNTILLGKTIYELTIHSKNDSSWNITYTAWGPNNLHSKLAEQNFESADNLYIQPLHDSSVLALDSDSKSVKWVASLPYVTVNVFDVYFDEDSSLDSQLIVLPHPLNGEYMRNPEDPNDETSTYIERTKEGSWFAMNEVHYPSLVRSAPIAKYISSERWRVPSILSNSELLGIAITGVHDNSLRNSGDNPASPNGHNDPLEVYDPLQLPSVMPTGDAMSRSRPTSAYSYRDYKDYKERLGIEGPPANYVGSLPGSTYRFSSWKRLVYRAFENVVVACLGILILLVLSRLGLLQSANKLLTLIGLGKRPELELKVESESGAEEGVDSKHPEDEVSLKRKVKFIDRANVLEPKADLDAQDTSRGSVDLNGKDGKSELHHHKRKRGSRGGRKNKKKDFVSVVTTSAMESTDSDALVGNNNNKNVQTIQINESLSMTDKILGYGSHGTVVFRGSFEDRPVAVKRMLIDFYKIASQEIKLLQESDDHSNVIRYFCSQQTDGFLYIALELCTASLEDVIERRTEACKKILEGANSVNVLWQITNGLHHLHALKIVHRDIKPQNILVAEPKKLDGKDEYSDARILISDFGLCKKLEADQSSFRATTAQGAGTSGWRAPELLLDDADALSVISDSVDGTLHTDSSSVLLGHNRRLTRAIDIFSTGCVFYHFLTGGGHPFGDKYSREGNIIKGIYDLSLLDDTLFEYESKDLISSMINHDPTERPNTTQVMKHPYFWPIDKKLNFLLKVSDRFEVERRDPPSTLLLKMEDCGCEIIDTKGKGWYGKFDEKFLNNLGKYRKYSSYKLMDLLRALRNKYHHFKDMPEDLAVDMGPLPEGFYDYFLEKFPNLLMVIYQLIEENLKDDELLGSFF